MFSTSVATSTLTPPPADTNGETQLKTAGTPPPAGTHAETHLDTTGRSAIPAATGILTAGAAFGRRYRILRTLGQGGMGVVYQAWDEELGLAVALKTIRPEVMSDPISAADVERRFKRELLLARQVTHRHVVRIHDLGEVDGVKYLTMPFIEGQPLSAEMAQSGKLPVGRALQIVREIADGLIAAHGAGVVHRDLKPENVMLDVDGHSIIMDFGISRSITGTGAGTAMGTVVGTLEYMSPEQARGEVADQRSDIYALGLIFYDMIVGRRRFVTGTSPMSEAMSRMQQAPTPVRALQASVPEPVERMVSRCLEPDPAKRYQTVAELLTDLNRLDADGHEPAAPLPGSRLVPRFAQGWPRAAQLALLGAVFLLALAPSVLLGVMAANWLRSPDAAPVAPEPVSVLIADFQNQTGDPVFDGSLEQALGIGIEAASFITSYPREGARQLAGQLQGGERLDEAGARLVAIREGIKVILAGSIASSGSRYALEVKAIDPANGQVLAAASGQPSGKTDVLEVLGSVAAQLRGALGDTTPESVGLAAAETFSAASLDAVKHYSTAQDLASRGRDEEAIPFYRAAIEQDGKFGRAYSGWAISAYTLGRRQEADEKWKEALSLLDRMTDREQYRTLGSYYLRSGSYEKAIENYSALVQRYPADRAGHSNLALSYFYSLDFARALEHGRKAIEIFPKIARFRNNYALYAMYAGDFTTAEREARTVLEQDPAFHRARLPIAIAAVVAGDFERAQREYSEMQKGDPRARLQASLGLADLALYRGRPGEAIDLLTAELSSSDSASAREGVSSKSIVLSEAQLEAGREDESAKTAAAALEAQAKQSLIGLPAVRVLIRAGRARQAAQIASGWETQLQSHPRAYAKVIEGEIGLSEKRFADAIQALRAAEPIADLWLRRFLLGAAYVQAGHYAEALSELNECQKRRGEATALLLDDLPTVRYLATLPYWLGRAQEGLNISSAAENYRAFLSLRPEATDALSADARRRLGTN